MTDQTLPTVAELRHEMREELAKLRADKAELLAALERIANHQLRSDRRARGMVDVFEIDTLQRIARVAIAAA